jgi:hypothetical protein
MDGEKGEKEGRRGKEGRSTEISLCCNPLIILGSEERRILVAVAIPKICNFA